MNQRAVYEALQSRLEDADLDLIVGVPTALHRTPAAWLVSTLVQGAPASTFGRAGQLSIGLRPTLTLAVPFQDQQEAEWQIVDLVDAVIAVLWSTPLAGACTVRVETIQYDWRDLGGIQYRVADLTLVATQL